MIFKLKPKYIGQIAIILWVVFSIAYIAYDQWNSFKTGALQGAYYAGRADCVNDLINEVKAASCGSVSIYNDTEQVDVINAQCFSANKSGE